MLIYTKKVLAWGFRDLFFTHLTGFKRWASWVVLIHMAYGSKYRLVPIINIICNLNNIEIVNDTIFIICVMKNRSFSGILNKSLLKLNIFKVYTWSRCDRFSKSEGLTII